MTLKQSMGRISPFGEMQSSTSLNNLPINTNSSKTQFGAITTSTIQSVTTKHKSFFSVDKALIKEVVETAIRGQRIQHLNNMLRRHFVELTDRFMQPLNRYFESLVIGNHMSM